MNTNGMPLWQKNFQLFSKSYPILQLSGCIEDLTPYRSIIGTGLCYLPLDEWIYKTFSTSENTVVVFYSVLNGFSNPYSPEHLNQFRDIAGNGNDEDFAAAAQRIVRAFGESQDKRLVIVFDASLRCLTAGPIIQPGDQRAFTALKGAAAANIGGLRHQLIFISEKPGDLPSFLLATQSYAKSLIIARPDQIQRCGFLSYLFANRNFTQTELHSVAQRAENLTLKEIRTALTDIDPAACTPGDLTKQISLFQFGFSEDPWNQLDPEKIDRAEEILGQYVFGQEEAVRYAAETIKYAASGFGSVFQEDGRTAPKGLMFFCGLSGTGKTELAKAVARLVFGSADAMIRFDMGEYNQPHSAERLTGSPPGYVGHDAGGQLTEAIKAHPFCLLLFDEIEKADPAVMNKFLSILEDGRLTDGKGETVSFENTIIVFTSNLGAAEATGEENPARVRTIIADAVKHYCEEQPPMGIGKPELYSRLAGSIVVFKPLSEDAIQRIFENYFDQAIRKISDQMKITVTCGDAFLDKLRTLINEERERGHFPGGRGMKKAMDKYFIVPLSSFSHRNRCRTGDRIALSDFTINEGVVTLTGEIVRAASLPLPADAQEPAQPQNPYGFRVTPPKKTNGFTVKRS